MEYHNVATVEVEDEEAFKGEEVVFQAIYVYCSNTDEYLETEDMIRRNSRAMKDAYREKVGLLTSREIMAIRKSMASVRKILRRSWTGEGLRLLGMRLIKFRTGRMTMFCGRLTATRSGSWICWRGPGRG